MHIGYCWEIQISRSRHKWVGNVKINHGEIGWGGMVKIDVAQDRDHWKALVNVMINPGDP
jgi:hypothetical protein